MINNYYLSKFSHVKWFSGNDLNTSENLNLYHWLFVAIMVLSLLFGLKLISKTKTYKSIDNFIKLKFSPLQQVVTLVVRLTAAAGLLINLAQGYLFAPNLTSDSSILSQLISILFIIASIMLILGMFTRVAALLMLLGYILGFAIFNFIDLIDHFEYVGLSLFILLGGGGRYSLDSYLDIEILNKLLSKYKHVAYDALRISIGIGLISLSLSEKLLGVDIASSFLSVHDWNILSIVGIGDFGFIVFAGAIELLLGLALIFNVAARAVVLIILSTMTLTAMLLGIDEVYGHLFAIALVISVLVGKPKK